MSDEIEREEEKEFDPTDIKNSGKIFDLDEAEAEGDAVDGENPEIDPSAIVEDEEIDEVNAFELYEADTDDIDVSQSYSY